MTVKYVDLFCGVGGFHAIGHSFRWESGYACDIDPSAREIYALNWGQKPAGDITQDANEESMLVPRHDVLFAGFPCQPFSKSGKQKGMDETRGTLFWNIAHIIEKRKPKVVLLENVANLAGPRHRHEWDVIIRTLRELDYRVSETPLFISPHNILPQYGGRPQNRPRVYIAATYVPKRLQNKHSLFAESLYLKKSLFNKKDIDWNLKRDLPKEPNIGKKQMDLLGLSESESFWLKVWEDLLQRFPLEKGQSRLPGFPFWADVWIGSIKIRKNDPIWKKDFIYKNLEFYELNKKRIDSWLNKYDYLEKLPSSRRKFEWQAGDAKSIYNCLIQLRPSGIRVKRANYAPAAVAINQTPILGELRRKLSTREVAYLQGLPKWFSFEKQSEAKTYKQLGNGISIGAAYQCIKALVERDHQILNITCKEIVESVKKAPRNPDTALRTKN